MRDTVVVVCDRRPERHYLQAWIEYRPFDTWDSYGRHLGTLDIPDSEGLRFTVSHPCLEGRYRTRAHAEGRGPATEQAPDGVPFEFENTGLERFISAQECGEGDG